jgi:hypothetical protein
MAGSWGMWNRNRARGTAQSSAQVAEWKTDWRPPSELERSTPRPIRLTGAGRAVTAAMILMIAGSVALGVWLSALRHREQARAAALAAEGVTVEAQIVRTGIDSAEDRRPFVVYEYTAGGRTYQGRTTLQRSDSGRFPEGAAATVRYLPAEPGRSWLAGHGPEGPPAWVPFVAPTGMIIGAVAIAFSLRRQRRLLAEGRPAQGRVISSRRVYTQHSSGYRVVCELRTRYGATLKVKLRSSRRPPAQGSVVTMLYDPDVPKRAAIYPLPLVRVDLGFGR